MSDIWKDPAVRSALEEGRSADDIKVMDCPSCGQLGYYNEGSHFHCRPCRKTWYCCSEDEEPPPDRAYLYIEERMRSLGDTVGEVDDGP